MPYALDIGIVQGDVAQTLANLTALRNDMLANPLPECNIHGHSYKWTDLYRFVSQEIDNCMRQLSRLDPFEEVGIAR